MDAEQKASFEAQSRQLRADLKAWETSWAKSHDGTKPSRDDIKRNVDIAQKYKQYNKIRDIISGKAAPPTKHDADGDAANNTAKQPKHGKRKSDDTKPAPSPHKKQRNTETPSRTDRVALYSPASQATPSIARNLFSPVAPRSIGPTPQRDGRVLGLFDLMVEKNLGTPSKSNGTKTTQQTKAGKVQATPTKRKASETETTANENDAPKAGAATPVASSKRQRRSSQDFATPLKPRDANAHATPVKSPAGTPSVSKLQFNTPAFLKRHSLQPLDENSDADFSRPAPLRLPRKPLGRGLSAIVASLRKVEEEEHDDDLEAMREMEAMEHGGGAPPAASPAKATSGQTTSDKTTSAAADSTAAKTGDDILVPDSQSNNLLLGGFDDEAMYDSPVEGDGEEGQAVGRDGKPLRVYKKKGQKRTTRRSNMKPTRSKRPTTEAEGREKDDDADGVVPETQYQNNTAKGDDGVPDDIDEFIPSDIEGEGDGPSKATKSRPEKNDKKRPAAEKKEGPVKKVARKVNELAHANFRRLKLKNHGAKGGPGHNSKFRRRR